MLEVLILFVPPPVKVKLPILIVFVIFLVTELFTVKPPLPVKVPKEIVPLPLLKLLVPLMRAEPKVRLLFVVFTVPLSVVVLAVLVKPLLKLKVPPFPRVTPFVLLKVVALLIVFVPEPKRFTA